MTWYIRDTYEVCPPSVLLSVQANNAGGYPPLPLQPRQGAPEPLEPGSNRPHRPKLLVYFTSRPDRAVRGM
jgi:hypothetical protein